MYEKYCNLFYSRLQKKMALLDKSLLLVTASLVLSILLLLYLYFQDNFRYWEKRGVPNAMPTMLFGKFKNCSLQKESVGQFLRKVYNEGAGKPFLGFYVFGRCE
jgi:hypothetical protein